MLWQNIYQNMLWQNIYQNNLGRKPWFTLAKVWRYGLSWRRRHTDCRRRQLVTLNLQKDRNYRYSDTHCILPHFSWVLGIDVRFSCLHNNPFTPPPLRIPGSQPWKSSAHIPTFAVDLPISINTISSQTMPWALFPWYFWITVGNRDGSSPGYNCKWYKPRV